VGPDSPGPHVSRPLPSAVTAQEQLPADNVRQHYKFYEADVK
jgi:hypothetical protein